MTPEMRKKIVNFLLNSYVWPQVMERQPYEKQWDDLQEMAKAALKVKGRLLDKKSRIARRRRTNESPNTKELDDDANARVETADTVIFDAIDRLTNLNHFVSFKNAMPVQYQLPPGMVFPNETEVYSPSTMLLKAANSWLQFNADNTNFYRKHWMCARHHYTYGVSFAFSEYKQVIAPVPRRQPDKTFKEKLELMEIGTTFEPISIRKLWLNYRLSPYEMNYQACPFFFEVVPRFAVVARQYDPALNPFGFSNTENLPKGQWLFAQSETDSLQKSFQKLYPQSTSSLGQLLDPQYAGELLWTMFPMIPLGQHPETQELILDEDGTQGIPHTRFVVQLFGGGLTTGQVELVRMQKNFYPHDILPLYGSAHMPTVDDGAYSPAIGSILGCHYQQIGKCLTQMIENRDWCNDPPTEVNATSPAIDKDINEIGGKISVLGPNEIKRREPFDMSGTTPALYGMLRDSAQTSSKSTDAILGKAMGSRTSATEADNVFTTAMSGVTTDVNLFQHDISGGFAERCWEYTGLWVDPDVLAAVTGSFGYAIRPEFLQIRLGLKWDTGSQFIESMTRQQNYQWLLANTPPGDPTVNRPYLYRELLTEWKIPNVNRIINDQGMEQQSIIAFDQCVQTYLGAPVLIDPDQNHQLAISVKKSFLADRKSPWNNTPEFVQRGPLIVRQIMMHQQYLQLQLLQAQAQQMQQMGQQLQAHAAQQETIAANRPPPSAPRATVENAGDRRQQTGR